jgi:Domain of unknown function (DUF1840)
MLYEFKSRATGNVIMTQNVAESILDIIGKPRGPQGIILPEQMPAAMAAIAAAVDRERAAVAKPLASDPQPETDEPIIGLAQRVFPFSDMLRRAHAASKEITWGA